MAMLASKSSLSSGLGSSSATSQLQAARDYSGVPGSRRTPLSDTANHGTFASPTESEFSETYDGTDSVRSWDEKQVGDWLKSIGCGIYAATFKENNVNGNNLIECDQAVLKEMGIKKIGDRVRIFVGIKALRTKAIPNQKKRNRESILALDHASTLSPRITGTGSYTRLREHSTGSSSTLATMAQSTLSPNYPYSSPKAEYLQGQSGYFPLSTSRRPETPSDGQLKTATTTKRLAPTTSKVPNNRELIRVISGGHTKLLAITGWKNYEDVMSIALRKMNRPDANPRNYCFYVHEPVAEDRNRCRRLTEADTLDLLRNPQSKLRLRLILRTIHSGEPEAAEIEKSHDLAMDELKQDHQAAIEKNKGSIGKLGRILGESSDVIKAPLSPAVPLSTHTPMSSSEPRRQAPTLPDTKMSMSKKEREAVELDVWSPPRRLDSKRQQPIPKFQGTRPPSELINHDLSSYFTEHDTKDLQRTVSMAQRRSARVSKALSRISVASNFSIKDLLKDAPALPPVPANFLGSDPFPSLGSGSTKSGRPLSVWRQSIALPSVREDESKDKVADRKSFASSVHSSSEDSLSKTDTLVPGSLLDETSSLNTYLEDGTTSSTGTGTGGQNTLNEQYREALQADGEGPDEELEAFLGGNTFDKFSWMQGDLIGQGSFGSVYLALHAVTGELMAVKQVELPGKAGADAALEKRKESMLAALKREINLLSELQHEHIVQYLGVQATDEHLNIFLEYVPGGSVASMLNNYGHLQEQLIRNLVRQTLDGLTYLHKRDIIHRDIKGANILVDNKGKVKISDFGISKKVDLQSASSGTGQPGKGANKRVSMQGSVFWMAPEVVKQTSYTRKADIWSLGALIVEMFTGEHPYPKLNQMQVIFRLGGHQKPDIPESASQDAKDFLARTFEIDESARPEAADLMKLPFMKGMAA